MPPALGHFAPAGARPVCRALVGGVWLLCARWLGKTAVTVKVINLFLPFRKCNRRWGLKVPCASSHRNPIFNRIAAPQLFAFAFLNKSTEVIRKFDISLWPVMVTEKNFSVFPSLHTDENVIAKHIGSDREHMIFQKCGHKKFNLMEFQSVPIVP